MQFWNDAHLYLCSHVYLVSTNITLCTIPNQLHCRFLNKLQSYKRVECLPLYPYRGTVMHYGDVIMSAMASQITSLAIVYSTVSSGADQRKHQSSASLAFVRGIHRWPVNSPHKGPVTRKLFPYDDVIMGICKINHGVHYVLDHPCWLSWHFNIHMKSVNLVLLITKNIFKSPVANNRCCLFWVVQARLSWCFPF